LCSALKEDRILAHSNIAKLLLQGMMDAAKGLAITVEQTVASLQQLEEQTRN
jgi:hypothetical protein